MDKQKRIYTAYLLRLWQTVNEDKLCWQASLQSSHTGKRVGFTSLDDLFDTLRKEIDVSSN